MARGGQRPGSGRKRGSATKKTREIADKAAAEGITPLEFMLNIMRDDVCPEGVDGLAAITFHTLRFEAAKAAAPYMHPRLAAIEHSTDPDRPMVQRIEQVIVDTEG